MNDQRTRIGPFRVLRPIAEGGMAEVYEVEDPNTGEHYACKLLIAVKSALKRFNREYEAMTRLNHPSIVRVYHYGLHDGHPWLTMELLSGIPAQAWVKNRGRPGTTERTNEVLRIAAELALALHYVHDRGLVHRDLKSANVLVLADGRVKLVDFGTAHLHDASQRITMEGEFVGTFAYASPEQVSGRPIDGRSDLYSFGVLLYRLLTGRRPFGATDSAALINAHLTQAPPDPRLLVAELDERLAYLVLQLLSKRPEDRPTADVVARRLEGIAGHSLTINPPLVLHREHATEREHQRRAIAEHLASAPGAGALVVGDQGSDRRRVVDALMAQALERGTRVFHCNLTEGADVTALMGMLKVIGRQGNDGQKAVRALRKITTANATQLAVGKVRQTLRKSVMSTLRGFTEKSEVLIGAHGIENASPLTLELLAGVRAASAEHGIPVGLVASCSASAFATRPEIRRRLPDVPVFRLEPLDPGQLAQAVGGMLGRRPPPAHISRQLFDVTDGQPVYVEEAVRDLLASGTMRADDGNRVEWGGSNLRITYPRRARQDAQTILGEQPVLHRRVLEAMAVADLEVPLDLLAAGLEWDRDEVRLVAEQLVAEQVLRWVSHPRDRLTEPTVSPLFGFGAADLKTLVAEGTSTVESTPTDRLRWRLPRLRELVLADIEPCRRRVHERRMAAAIRPYAPSPAQVRLLLSADDPIEAGNRCVRAARRAIDHYRYRAALEMLEPVVARASDLTPELRAEANLLYVRCLRVVRPFDPSGARALAVARQLATPPLAAEIELAAARLAFAIGHYANHRKYLDAAWKTASEQSQASVMSEIALENAESYGLRGKLRDCETWVEHARSAAIRSGSSGAMGEATVALARLQLARGELREAEQTAAKAMQFFTKGNDLVGLWRSVPVFTEALRYQGRYSEALRMLAQRGAEAREGDDPAIYVQVLMSAVCCELDLCRLGRAQELVDEIIATLREGERLALRLEARMLDGRIKLASGQPMQAAFILQDTVDKARKAELFLLAERARTYLAETTAGLGDLNRAASLYKSTILNLMGMGDRLALAEACASKSRVISEDPAATYKAVLPMLEEKSLPSLAIELRLASAAWARQTGQDPMLHYRGAARTMNQLATGLNDTDRAALRVHPWSRRIRAGLG